MFTNIKKDPFRNTMNLFFLAISCSLIFYFLTGLLDKLYFQIAAFPVTILLEVGMQYFVFSTGKLKWRNGEHGKAIWLWFAYAAYILVFAMGSAIGFFFNEIQINDIKYEIVVNDKSQIRYDLQKNKDEQDALLIRYNELNKNGYYTRAEKTYDELLKLQKERKVLLSSQQKTFSKHNETSKNFFKTLATSFKWNENLLKLLVFGTLVLAIYLLIILTSWDIEDKKSKNNDSGQNDSNSVPENNQIFAEQINEENEDDQEVEVESIDDNTEGDELQQFIDALFDGTKRQLNGDPKIAKKTGIPPGRRAELRRMLKEHEIDGQPAFDISQGKITANFPKEVIWESLKNQTNNI